MLENDLLLNFFFLHSPSDFRKCNKILCCLSFRLQEAKIQKDPFLDGFVLGAYSDFYSSWLWTPRFWSVLSLLGCPSLGYTDFSLPNTTSEKEKSDCILNIFVGVETTRHFLLEWLSYTYRYVPVGLLDVIPQKLNWRPPSYYGRDDLETLMASDSAADWVMITGLLIIER